MLRYTDGMDCEWCGERIIVSGFGRTPRFCSTRCRVANHRARDAFPARLETLDRWLRWKLTTRKGRLTKVPLTIENRPASSIDPDTWTDFASAKSSMVGDGLGFALGGGIACIDIDHCLTDRVPDARAQAVLDRTLGAYVEISPGGDGLHVWGLAPEQRGRRRDGLECYSAGRYMTVTGEVFRPGGLIDLDSFFT